LQLGIFSLLVLREYLLTTLLLVAVVAVEILVAEEEEAVVCAPLQAQLYLMVLVTQ
jgi:hypothetical protein